MIVRMYLVSWDNGHASGTFPEVFTSHKEAKRFAVDWKREMVAIEPTYKLQAEARQAYSWEVDEYAFRVEKVYMWPGHAWYVYRGIQKVPILKECPFRLVRSAIVGWMRANWDKLSS